MGGGGGEGEGLDGHIPETKSDSLPENKKNEHGEDVEKLLSIGIAERLWHPAERRNVKVPMQQQRRRVPKKEVANKVAPRWKGAVKPEDEPIRRKNGRPSKKPSKRVGLAMAKVIPSKGRNKR